jgi:sulfatase maturation enzyme AslB (radical SAM superfamily)
MSAAPRSDPRLRPGYIQPHALRELWFHTGTACNLACPFCLEGSQPGDTRLGRITLEEVRPLLHEALELGVEQFSFTGGEPFIVKDFVNILGYAAALKPCLVLTNGTDPVLKRLRQIEALRGSSNPIRFRISIDYPDAARHDAGRGSGSYAKAWRAAERLYGMGFPISLARQVERGDAAAETEHAYRCELRAHGLPENLPLVGFPDFLTPGAHVDVPFVSEHCMTTYQSEEARRTFMCAFSKMIIKRQGRLRVYACTLVDDDPRYDLGATLGEALPKRILLKHHRCHTCFAFGASCSELAR